MTQPTEKQDQRDAQAAPEPSQASALSDSSRVLDNLDILAEFSGNKRGKFNVAYTLVTNESGMMIATRLEGVTAKAAFVAEIDGIHTTLVPEYRATGMKRLFRAIKRRTMEGYKGWI